MKVYKLLEDNYHLLDSEMDFDATSEPFNGRNTIGYDMKVAEDFVMPKEIYFRANLNIIPAHTDFPVTDLRFPIFSNRMIDIIESIKPFSKKLLPTIMIDDTYLDDYKDEYGEFKENVRINTSYFGVQFLERIGDCFNYEKSVYSPLISKPEFPGIIKKMVLKIPNMGFPSIFRIKEKPSMIFISQETKDALERNDIKGCVFEEVEVS